MNKLPDRILEYRAKENLSQAALAKRVGVSVQTINSIENGSQEPGKLTRAKIELVIGKEEK